MFLYRILDKLTQNVIIVMPWSVHIMLNLTHVIYQIGYRISAYFDINISVVGKSQNLYIGTPLVKFSR